MAFIREGGGGGLQYIQELDIEASRLSCMILAAVVTSFKRVEG